MFRRTGELSKLVLRSFNLVEPFSRQHSPQVNFASRSKNEHCVGIAPSCLGTEKPPATLGVQFDNTLN